MSLDTVTPKGMLIESYNCISQVLIAPAGSEEIQCISTATLEGSQIGQLEGRAYKSSSPYGGAADPTQERAKIESVMRA
jgi:hypothetical protein